MKSKLTLSIGVICAATTYTQQVEACGGFFCSQTPVVQQAERILFVDHPDDTVSAVVQIQYSGPAERFAWLLPVPGIPDIGVSSNVVFTVLQQRTNPSYILNTTLSPECGVATGGQDAGLPAVDSGTEPTDPPVTVVAEDSVGPYDYQIISLRAGTEQPEVVAIEWLTENEYDVTGVQAETLRPYLEAEMNLLAVRLSKDRESGQIRPLRLRYDSADPMIPIRPTAVAAADDMGVMAFVVGNARAVPLNYLSLELDEAVIDWFRGGFNYNDVVSRAADEAGGHGFVTEFADRLNVENLIFPPTNRANWEFLRTSDDEPGLLVTSIMRSFGAWDGMRDVVAAHVPLPEGVTVDEFFNCVSCYTTDAALYEDFDRAAYLAAVAEQVIDPVEQTAALVPGMQYMTRLYTQLSAAEMTKDPAFGMNPDLPTVSNVHIAEESLECDTMGTMSTVTLPDGRIIRARRGDAWPTTGSALATADELSREGFGNRVIDNRLPPGSPIPEGFERDSLGQCNCRTAGAGAAEGIVLVVGLLGVFWGLRRRRR